MAIRFVDVEPTPKRESEPEEVAPAWPVPPAPDPLTPEPPEVALPPPDKPERKVRARKTPAVESEEDATSVEARPAAPLLPGFEALPRPAPKPRRRKTGFG